MPLMSIWCARQILCWIIFLFHFLTIYYASSKWILESMQTNLWMLVAFFSQILLCLMTHVSFFFVHRYAGNDCLCMFLWSRLSQERRQCFGVVGQLVDQFAKLTCCYVVGSDGSKEKVFFYYCYYTCLLEWNILFTLLFKELLFWRLLENVSCYVSNPTLTLQLDPKMSLWAFFLRELRHKPAILI